MMAAGVGDAGIARGVGGRSIGCRSSAVECRGSPGAGPRDCAVAAVRFSGRCSAIEPRELPCTGGFSASGVESTRTGSFSGCSRFTAGGDDLLLATFRGVGVARGASSFFFGFSAVERVPFGGLAFFRSRRAVACFGFRRPMPPPPRFWLPLPPPRFAMGGIMASGGRK